MEEQHQQRMQLRHLQYEKERNEIIERIKMKSHRKPDGQFDLVNYATEATLRNSP
jgi:hypothetical protein